MRYPMMCFEPFLLPSEKFIVTFIIIIYGLIYFFDITFGTVVYRHDDK